MKKISLLIVFAFTLSAGQTQPWATLLEELPAQNRELQALHHEYLAALEKAPQVNRLPDPELGLGAFPLPVETRLGPQVARFSATQMFPWRGTLERRETLENARAQVRYESIAIRQLDLAYELQGAWLQLYEIRQRKGLLARNITLLAGLERLALARVESGKANAADVLRVQLSRREQEQQLALLEPAEVSPTAIINNLLYRPLDTPVVISDSLVPAVLVYDAAAVLAQIQSSHPLVRSLAQEQVVAQENIALNTLNGKPSFGVGVDYILVNQRDMVELPDNGKNILQVRATIKIPLNREPYRAKEREERLRITALQDRTAAVESNLATLLTQAYAELATAQLEVDFLAEQLVITRAAIHILTTAYSTGGQSLDELLRLEKESLAYEIRLLHATVATHLAKSKVERLIPKF